MHTLGPYSLIRKLGQGGMAQLYQGRREGPEGFAKTVAVKCILPDLAQDPEFLAMFLDEARLAARLSHPHIVQIHDFGCFEDTYFIAMELVAGEDLATVLSHAAEREPRPSSAIIATILATACDALHYAHTLTDETGAPLNLIHRDVTPSNLLVSFDGVIKLADFGIARAEQRISSTRIGTVRGKLAYLAPEYALGRSLDGRSDQFSLGVIGYELLTGKRPFETARRTADLSNGIATPIVRPSQQRSDVDPVLEAIVMRALEYDPAQRYRSAQAMQLDLERYLVGTGSTGTRMQIAEYMRELFGEQRVQTQRNWAAGALPSGEETASQPARGNDATRIIDRSASKRESKTQLDVRLSAREHPRSRRSIAWPWISIGLVAAGGLLAWRIRSDSATKVPLVDAGSPVHADAPLADVNHPVALIDGAIDGAVDSGVAAPDAPVSEKAAPIPRRAKFSLAVTPQVEIFIDGKRLGRSPVSRDIRPGKHRVSLQSADGCRLSYAIEVAPGQVLAQERVLRTGKVSVKIDDGWADIYIGGRRVEQTPAVLTLNEGVCLVKLVQPSSDRFKVVEVTVDPTRLVVLRTSFD